MKELICGSCTTCCQFSGQKEVQVMLEENEIAHFKTDSEYPHLLATQENGDCVYLDRVKGCTIHDRSPLGCRSFDCRELLNDIMEDERNVMMRSLMEAVRMRLEDTNESRILLSTAVTTALKH